MRFKKFLKNHKKLVIVSSILILSFILGFIFSWFLSFGYYAKIWESLKHTNFMFYIVVLLFFFIFFIAVHELTHALIFKINGLHIRSITVSIFSLKRKNKKMVFSVNFKLIKLVGGVVTPQISSIENNNEYKNVVKSFYRSLLWAPLVSVIFTFVWCMFSVIIIAEIKNAYLITLFTLSFFEILIIGILTLMSSFAQNANMYGDFIAMRKMIRDKAFQLVNIEQCISYSNVSINTKQYMYNKTIYYLLMSNKQYHLLNLSLLEYAIMHTLFDNIQYFSNIIEYVKGIFVKTLLFKKQYYLISLIIAFLYKNNEVEEFNKWYEALLNTTKNEETTYLITKLKYMLSLDETTTYEDVEKLIIKCSSIENIIYNSTEEEKKTIVKINKISSVNQNIV